MRKVFYAGVFCPEFFFQNVLYFSSHNFSLKNVFDTNVRAFKFCCIAIIEKVSYFWDNGEEICPIGLWMPYIWESEISFVSQNVL